MCTKFFLWLNTMQSSCSFKSSRGKVSAYTDQNLWYSIYQMGQLEWIKWEIAVSISYNLLRRQVANKSNRFFHFPILTRISFATCVFPLPGNPLIITTIWNTTKKTKSPREDFISQWDLRVNNDLSFSRTDHMIGHETNLNTFESIGIIQSMSLTTME